MSPQMSLNTSLANWMCIKCGKANQEQQKSPEIFNHGFLAASKAECASTSAPSLVTAKSFHWLSPWDLNAASDQFQCRRRGENPLELSWNPVVHQSVVLSETFWDLGCHCGRLSKKCRSSWLHTCETEFNAPLQNRTSFTHNPFA